MTLRRILPLAAATALMAAAQSDPWAPLRVFEGKWEGPTSGKPGTGSTTREFRFEMNGRFLSQRDRSVYQQPDPAAKPLVHEDFGFFSYDANLKKVVWRQFHSEELVNEYTLNSVSPDGSALEFDTTRIENLPGFRAINRYRIVSADEIEETAGAAGRRFRGLHRRAPEASAAGPITREGAPAEPGTVRPGPTAIIRSQRTEPDPWSFAWHE
jgi:hypothetical protein